MNYRYFFIFTLFIIGCFSIQIPRLEDNFYNKLYLTQPIQVIELDNDKQAIYELYIENNDQEYDIFAIHPLIGKILTFKVSKNKKMEENAKFIDDLKIIDKTNFLKILSFLNLKFKEDGLTKCKYENVNNNKSLFKLTLSKECQ